MLLRAPSSAQAAVVAGDEGFLKSEIPKSAFRRNVAFNQNAPKHKSLNPESDTTEEFQTMSLRRTWKVLNKSKGGEETMRDHEQQETDLQQNGELSDVDVRSVRCCNTSSEDTLLQASSAWS